jgi:hypothetical protein
MEYLMLVIVDPTGEPRIESEDRPDLWVKELEAKGKRVRGDRLRPPEDATLLRRRKGELLVTTGPFTESAEWVAGYDILDCDSLDEAVELAAKHPMARFGAIEVRPTWPMNLEAGPPWNS